VNHVVSGTERITYHNNSPDELTFLWLQLDQNVRSLEHSRSYRMQGALPARISPQFRRFVGVEQFDGGFTIPRVQLVDHHGYLVDAEHETRDTIMKVTLLDPLEPGESVDIELDWSFPVPDNGRGAKEQVKDGWEYVIAQWYPRMSVYDDVNGWETEQFLGRGEFYLNFGDFDVELTVPWNHIVDATGLLQNPEEVLTATQRQRLADALQSEEPKYIVGPDEVMTRASRPTGSGTLTWHFKAEDVRDFSWASSKTFVWDAAGFKYTPDSKPIEVHSLYPRDAMPLWNKASTRATIVTLESYGKMALPYPYPKAVNVNGPVGGMEYPMIAFCGARPNPDGTYNDAMERSLISVTIHEVGHNWVPMIIASDERKWTWMDEGLNTFLQYYGEQYYANKFKDRPEVWSQSTDGTYKSSRGPAPLIVNYMRNPTQVPIMTESDLIQNNFGDNGYSKPAAGLVMLREQILGEKAFDEAFHEYARRWAFHHPQPTDFFRTIEEAAGENLNWFWRGWFYTTYANDQALKSVTDQAADSLLGTTQYGSHYYRVEIENEGQLLMPVQIGVKYVDGSEDLMKLPIDIWRNNEITFSKGFFTDKKVAEIELDPNQVFADVNRDNNKWTAPIVDPSRREAGQ